MAKHKEQPKDLEIADRARRTAKILEGRIYVSRKGMCLVSGTPDFRVLRSCLQRISALPTWDAEPLPTDLGFRSNQITILTTETLAHCGHSLQKWRKVIQEQSHRRQKDAATRTRLAGWMDEATFLGERLDCLHALLRASQKPGWRIPSGFVTETGGANNVADQSGDELEGLPPSLWRWYGRIVGWMAGESARSRYLSSVWPLTDGAYARATRSPVMEIVRHAKPLLAMLEMELSETCPFTDTQSEFDRSFMRDLFSAGISDNHSQELAKMIHALPYGVSSSLGFKVRPPYGLSELEQLLSKCNTFLGTDINRELNPMVAGVAALCMLDGASVPLPHGLFLQSDGIDGFNKSLSAFYGESGKAAYDQLIEMFGRSCGQSDAMDPRSFGSARELLAFGASIEDVDWLGRHIVMVQFARKRCLPTSIRQIVQRTEVCGGQCAKDDVRGVLLQIGNAGDTSVADAFWAFMRQLPQSSLSLPLSQTIWNSFVQATFLSGLGARVRSVISRWATPPARLPAMPGTPAGISKELDLSLRRLAYYQKLSGKTPAIPGSMSALLGCKAKTTEELAYLESKQAQGNLAPKAKVRLDHLRERNPVVQVDSEKALRQAEEVVSITALEAISAIIDRESALVWASTCPQGQGLSLCVNHKIGIASWIGTLSRTSLKMLKELLDAWGHAGARYRHELTVNKAWFTKISRLGIAGEAWTNPAPESLQVGTRSICIMAAEDPIHVFLMGAYFQTCLDISSGCNRDAVLSNAYEANKTVMLAVDCDGRVVARKLVALNKRNEMIGYRLYSHGEEKDRAALDHAFQVYCGRWAATCGVRLGDEGTPERLTSLFWYDDKPEAWGLEAREELSRHHLASIGRQPGSDLEWGVWLKKMAGVHWPRCADLLRSIQLWPLPEGESADAVIANCPGLVEELLARMAWQTRDQVLAAALVDGARTAGGLLEALTAAARLQGEGGLPDPDGYIQEESRAWSSRIPAILVEAGTEKAVRCLAEHGLKRGDKFSLAYLLDAVHGSPAAARTVATFLAQEADWSCQFEVLDLLVKLIGRSNPDGRPDGFLAAIARHALRAPVSDKGPSLWAEHYVAEWLPRPRQAARVVDKAILEEAWICQSPGECDPAVAFRKRISILLWCLRNPCAGSLQFLQGCTGECEPVALLSLAILAPLRFKTTVENAWNRLPHVPALAMAYLLTHGILNKDFDPGEMVLTGDGQCQDWGGIAGLTLAIGNLDWSAIAKGQAGLSPHDRVACLPWLMWNVWGRLDSPAESIFRNRLDQDTVHGIWDSGVQMTGLLLQLADLLSTCPSPTESEHMRDCIHQLLKHRRYRDPYIDSRLLLWMDKLSRCRLYDYGDQSTPQKGIDRSFSFDEVGRAHDFLFDGAGRRNPICRVMGGISYLQALPLDLEQAVRMVELLVEKNGSDGKVYYKPHTEIEKRLIQHFMRFKSGAPARPVDPNGGQGQP